MKKNFIYSKKSVRTFKLRIEPSFLSHAERGKTFWIREFLAGMRLCWGPRGAPPFASPSFFFYFWRECVCVAPAARPHFGFQFRFSILAEGEGFEPSVQFYPDCALALRCTRPLCEPSTGYELYPIRSIASRILNCNLRRRQCHRKDASLV